MPGGAYAVATVVLAVIGFLAWFSRGQRRSAILAYREEEIRRIAKINEESSKIDEQTEKQTVALRDPATDPRAIWLRDQKRLPDISIASTPGDADKR